jgi:hypothetical protein
VPILLLFFFSLGQERELSDVSELVQQGVC